MKLLNNIFACIYAGYKESKDVSPKFMALLLITLGQVAILVFIDGVGFKLLKKSFLDFLPNSFYSLLIAIPLLAYNTYYFNNDRTDFLLTTYQLKSENQKAIWRLLTFLYLFVPFLLTIFLLQH